MKKDISKNTLDTVSFSPLDFGQNYSLERLILFKKITFQNSII